MSSLESGGFEARSGVEECLELRDGGRLRALG